MTEDEVMKRSEAHPNNHPNSRRTPPREDVPPSKRNKTHSDTANGTEIKSTRSTSARIEHKPSAPSRNATDSSKTPLPTPKTTYCHHDVSVPSCYEGNYDIHSLEYPQVSAKEYQFELDAFQRQSVKCIERNESVLVAAHTSAGKTAVAEYAIALALKNKQRVIYTSPIKALSNQKYRELQSEFSDVGLMTGDSTIDKNASCLVMTTEILRSMLYRGSEVVREVAWVIFDEVHYMRDKERGVVWEEAIILVPQNVRFVFLSATIPNAREFSEWIARLKEEPCHTIHTDTRPVPLKHFVYSVGAGAGIHLVVDQRGQFLANNFEKAMTEISATAANKSGPGRGALSKKKSRGPPNAVGKVDCFEVIELIHKQNYHPVIVFSFSRRDCEAYAMQLSKLDFNTEEEREVMEQIFDNAISSLNVEDRNLPQITAMLPLLRRGVGIHHSGLLPIIKEVVELMFNEGLIKCLFATETFAMGVNMPAHTVLFCQMRKFDGEKFRFLNGGEYIQMSGRAGRRGIDDEGVAILMCDEKIEPTLAKSLMSGASEPLNSTFRLGYNMLLNLMRAEEADPEFVIGRSFAQFQGDRAVPKLETSIKQMEAERDAIQLSRPDLGVVEHEVRSYFKLKEVAESIKKEMRDVVHQPGPVNQFLQPGRLLRVDMSVPKFRRDFGWGAIVDLKKKPSKSGGTGAAERYMVEVLLRCVAGSNRNGMTPKPYRPPVVKDEKDPRSRRKGPDEVREEWIVVPVSLKDLQGLSAIRVVKPPDLRSIENRAVFGRSVNEVLRRFPDGPPMLDPITDMGITDENLVVLLKKAEAVEEAMIACPVAKAERMEALAGQWNLRKEADAKVKEEKRRLKEARGLIFQEELKKMRRVLKRLGFTNADGIVEVKGRVACEVNTADELVITELLLGGNMNDMGAEVLVALCSCFVNDEGKRDEDVKLEKELQVAYDGLQAVATRVVTVKKEAGLHVAVEDVTEMFRPHAMRVVYYWMKGRNFSEVCQLSDLFEGSVIRIFRRLEELLRQLVMAVKAIGNTELADKFESGSATLKRGIAFHSSLYF